MNSVTVHICLYGELSCYGDPNDQTDNRSDKTVKLPWGSTLNDLMDYLLMCTRERGFTFINEKMSAAPNAQSDLEYLLQDGDRIRFFPLKLLPTQLYFDLKLTDKMTGMVRVDEDPNLYYLYD
jgi:hypothetical protein